VSPRASSYDTIIDAAETVVLEAGASHMTLDAVAAKAGVSKGGLLHHFPNKVSLLVAMVKRQIDMHQKILKKILGEIPEGPSRELKGFILSILYRERDRDNLGASLSAAVAHDPRLNEPVRKVVSETYARLALGGMPFEKAAIIALAADGLWLQEMLSISPFTEEQRKKIVDELLKLADEQVPDGKRGRKP
ncbi:MAG: TetR/AcrR family transcriptional regulator, partial [Syntrophorhabdus sp.]|jgi:AcrR family transcriptional regulator|nr:TetR/AcrR family transcriptional regulator [Syntrophorhabdus sp.]